MRVFTERDKQRISERQHCVLTMFPFLSGWGEKEDLHFMAHTLEDSC